MMSRLEDYGFRGKAEKRILEAILGHYEELLHQLDFENLKRIFKYRRHQRILQALSITEASDRCTSGYKIYNKLDIVQTLKRICANIDERVECEKVLLDLKIRNYSHFTFKQDVDFLRKETLEEEKVILKDLLDKDAVNAIRNGSLELARMRLEEEIFPNYDKKGPLLPFSASDIVQRSLNRQFDALGQTEEFSTGSTGLNSTLGGGVKPGQLTVLAAQPGVGKTTFALNIVNRQLSNVETPCVAIFTLEMNSEEIVENLLNIYHGNKLRTDVFHDENLVKVLAGKDIYVFDKEYDCMDKITTAIRKLKTEKNLKLVVIDYLQLISPDMRIREEQEHISHKLSNITRRLKELTLDLDISILCLSQLNRNFSNRVKYSKNKEEEKPELSDLRGSGTIEQDADVVLFLHEQEDHTLLTVAKNRRGKTGTIKFNFKKDYGKFEEIKK